MRQNIFSKSCLHRIHAPPEYASVLLLLNLFHKYMTIWTNTSRFTWEIYFLTKYVISCIFIQWFRTNLARFFELQKPSCIPCSTSNFIAEQQIHYKLLNCSGVSIIGSFQPILYASPDLLTPLQPNYRMRMNTLINNRFLYRLTDEDYKSLYLLATPSEIHNEFG